MSKIFSFLEIIMLIGLGVYTMWQFYEGNDINALLALILLRLCIMSDGLDSKRFNILE